MIPESQIAHSQVNQSDCSYIPRGSREGRQVFLKVILKSYFLNYFLNHPHSWSPDDEHSLFLATPLGWVLVPQGVLLLLPGGNWKDRKVTTLM